MDITRVVRGTLAVTSWFLGLLFLTGCGTPPALDIDPGSSRIYPGYKGNISRNGFSDSGTAMTLQPLWKLEFKYPLFYSPAMVDDYVFQPGVDKKIHVIDVNMGVEVAEIKVRRPIGTTPELSDSFMAICEEGENSELLVINYVSGQLLWKAKTFKVSLSPVLYDNKIFWVDGRNRVNAARLKDGESIWSVTLGSGSDCGPVFCNEKLFVATRDGRIFCLDSESGELCWEVIGVGRTNSSPACLGNNLYFCMADGVVACYDCSDGSLVWQRSDLPRLFYSPAVDDVAVYYGTADGRFVKLDRFNGNVIWEHQADAPVRGTALITSAAAIFASLDHKIYVLDKGTGDVFSSYETAGMVSAAPVLADDRLFIAAQDKILYCFYMAR